MDLEFCQLPDISLMKKKSKNQKILSHFYRYGTVSAYQRCELSSVKIFILL